MNKIKLINKTIKGQKISPILPEDVKNYLIDIDGTICTNSQGEYTNAKPILDRIAIVNKLYDEGNTIVFYTARGMGRYGNAADQAYAAFYDLTVKQLNNWNVKYNKLFLGKPSGDFYIDPLSSGKYIPKTNSEKTCKTCFMVLNKSLFNKNSDECINC